MKTQLNQYYQCSDRGYVKLQNVKAEHLPTINQIPISARCNQILPFKLHKIQVMEPIESGQTKVVTKELKDDRIITTNPHPLNLNKQTSLNYSFSVFSLKNPVKILQKDEVSSIHIDDKASARTIIQERNKDLTKSSFTYMRNPKIDMKRSLFETNHSSYTIDTNSKENQKLDMIISELLKQKVKRQEFQKKYQILYSLVNKTKKNDKQINLQSPAYSKDLPTPRYSPIPKKQRNYNIKSETQSDGESDEYQNPVMLNHRKSNSKRKLSSPSPIIINIGSEILSKSPSNNQSRIKKNSYQSTDLTEIKGTLQNIQNQVSILHQNVDFLEKKIDQQQMRRQKQLLFQELKEKQKKIEEMTKENDKIKEINDLLITKTIKPMEKEKQSQIINLKVEKSGLITGVCLSLLFALILLVFRSTICDQKVAGM